MRINLRIILFVLKTHFILVCFEVSGQKGDTVNNDTSGQRSEIESGYGTIHQKAHTGSSYTIKSEDISPSSYKLSDEMQGKVPGLEVRPGTGEVRIRGLNSIHLVSDPLWILDGMPLYSVRTFDDLQTVVSIHDIESFEVLKDARSCAMYGARGANGVILVKTKSGRSQK